MVFSEASIVFSLACWAESDASDLRCWESTSTRDEDESSMDGGGGARLPLEGMSVFGMLVCEMSVTGLGVQDICWWNATDESLIIGRDWSFII